MAINIMRDIPLPPIPDEFEDPLRDYLLRLHTTIEGLNKQTLDTFIHGVVHEYVTSVLDLSGSAATVNIFHAQFDILVLDARIVYSEASSADAGIALKLGKESDDDYIFTETSAVSQAQWAEQTPTFLERDISAGDTLIFSSAGGKTGTGEVFLTVELEYHLR